MRTGTGIFLIAAGAVLRFALAAGSPHGLNLHVGGVILISRVSLACCCRHWRGAR